MIRSQAARSLLQQKRLPLHFGELQLAEFQPFKPRSDEAEDLDDMSREELRALARGKGQDRKRPRVERPSPRAGVERGPRKCANCGDTHKELKCLKPQVDVKALSAGNAASQGTRPRIAVRS